MLVAIITIFAFAVILLSCRRDQGRRPREGRSPQNLRWGDGPCIGPPNILRSSVIGCAWKYEPSKKRCFSCEERVIYTAFNIVKIRKIWEKKGKIRKTRCIRNFYPENGSFSRKKTSFNKSWAAKKNFRPPQIRRQVSTTGRDQLQWLSRYG